MNSILVPVFPTSNLASKRSGFYGHLTPPFTQKSEETKTRW